MGKIKYDPKRWTRERKDHMNSPEVVKKHLKLIKQVRDYQIKRAKKFRMERGY